MSELTVGIEVEVHSNKITSRGELPEEWLGPIQVEASRVFFWSRHTREPLALTDLNRAVIASNEFTAVTLEVAQAVGNSGTLLEPSHQAKLELITPLARTQSQDDFRASTRDLLFVIHHLYFFIAAPCNEENRAILQDVGRHLETREYERDFQGFVSWYNDHLTTRGVSPAVHPPLDLEDYSKSLEVPQDVSFQFAKNDHNEQVTPLFAPQLTFSGPLERIPALFSTEEGTFQPRQLAVSSRRQDTAAFSPHDLELAAANLGYQVVDVLLAQSRAPRKAQKLWGFFTLVVYHLLRRVLQGRIYKEDARGGHPKDEFRFLLKSSLQSLYLNGLSDNDRAVVRTLSTSALIRMLTVQCKTFAETELWPIGNFVDLSKFLRDPAVLAYLSAIFDVGDYAAAIKALVDEYAPLSQTEREVPRKGGVHLERPVMEYRRLVGKQEKHFGTARETAVAIETLYNKLRFLESDVDPTRATRPKEGGTYYGTLAALSPRNVAVVNGLPRLELRLDTAHHDIEQWWRERSASIKFSA